MIPLRTPASNLSLIDASALLLFLADRFEASTRRIIFLFKATASVVSLWVLLSVHLLFTLLFLAPLARPALSSLDILLHLLRQESVDLTL